jgi:ATP/maltotriose-dependent transcriptional regulator MalT
MRGATGGTTVNLLTQRERQVLGLLASGCTYEKVACRLDVSLHTVTSHIKNAYRKLEVHSGPAAVMRAVQMGLL